MLIGITGQKRTGKDTVANYLVDKYRFNKHGFADKVKAMLYAINPIILDYSIFNNNLYEDTGDEARISDDLQTIVGIVGWEQAKEILEVRQLLQRLGTEGGRKLFGENFWVDQLFKELEENYEYFYSAPKEGEFKLVKNIQSNIVIPDVRFDNEAQRILDYGGYVIKVERDGLPVGDTHASEQPINSKLISETIDNYGSIEDLHRLTELALIGFDFVKPTGQVEEVSTATFDNLGTTVTGIDNIVPNESN